MSNTPITLRKTVVPVSFGVEIEGRSSILRNKMYSHLGFFFVTSDGSLEYSNSVELVSQPLPPKMLIRCLKAHQKKYGEIGHEYSGGIHIHVSKTKRTEQRLLELYLWIQGNGDFALTREFFGREPNYYCRSNWSVEDLKYERYSTVNFTNKNTIEVRLFGNSNQAYQGIESAICYIQRLNHILNRNTPLSHMYMDMLCKQYKIGLSSTGD
jgi:hypothetical protein